jgi:chlorite dismutase
MITVGMDYKVIPGQDELFLGVFDKVLGIINEMPGHQRTNLYRDVHAPHDYLLVSEWSDESAFRAFIASDRFRNVANWGRETVLRERPRHEVYGAAAADRAAAP